jgi:hypothetical protein
MTKSEGSVCPVQCGYCCSYWRHVAELQDASRTGTLTCVKYLCPLGQSVRDGLISSVEATVYVSNHMQESREVVELAFRRREQQQRKALGHPVEEV